MGQEKWSTIGSGSFSFITVFLLVTVSTVTAGEDQNQQGESAAYGPSQLTPESPESLACNGTYETPTKEGLSGCDHKTNLSDIFRNSSGTGSDQDQRNYTFIGARIETCQSYLCVSDSTKCTCNTECLVYQDCCIDFLDELILYYAKLENITIVSVSDLKKYFLKRSNIENHEFIVRHSSCIQTGHGQSNLLISKCPQNENIKSDIELRCDSELVPVSYKGPDSILSFKNPYCALCHGVNPEDITFWESSLECANPIYESDNSTKVLEECTVSFKATYFKNNIRKCMDNFTNDFSCESTWRKLDNIYFNLQEVCNSYILAVKYELESFKNPHCIACSANISYLGTREDSCLAQKEDDRGIAEITGSGLKLLFNFIPETGISVTKVCSNIRGLICTINEVLDCVSQTCRLLYCPSDRVPYFGECIAQNQSNFQLTLPIDNNLWHDGGIIISAAVIVNKTAVKIFAEMLDVSVIIKELNKTGMLQDVHSLSINTTSKNNTQEIIWEIEVTLVLSIARLLFELEGLVQGLFFPVASVADIRMSVRNFVSFESLTCPETMTKQRGFVNLTIDRTERKITASFGDINVDIFSTRFFMQIYPALSNKTSDAYICLPDKSLDCPMVAYNEDEFEILDGVLIIRNTSLSFPNGTYLLQNSKAFVCSHSLKPTDIEFKFFEYAGNQWILSACTCTISMVFLLVVVILHCSYSRLRNLHGLNLTALSINLFLAQGVTLLNGLPTGPLCTITGIVTHYLWLSVFVWMSIIGLDMARTFGAKISSSRAVAGERFRRYLIVSVVLPLLLVSVCVAIDFSKTDFRIGYGGKGGVCWISNPVALLVFVSVPIGLAICSNAIMFTITVCAIESAKSISKRALAERNRGYLLVYFKLTVVLGFTWIFGFIAAFVRKEELWYVYIILNGLQGFSIFVCFVLNKRVVGVMTHTRTKSSTMFSNITMNTTPTNNTNIKK